MADIHQVCKKGFYVAIISANVETNNPEAELKPAFDLLGTIKEKFVTVIFPFKYFPLNNPLLDFRYL